LYLCQQVVEKACAIRSLQTVLFSIDLLTLFGGKICKLHSIYTFAAPCNIAPRCYSCCVSIVVTYSGSGCCFNLQVWDTSSIPEFSANFITGICSYPTA
jgi:hypothetical protein